MPSIAQEALTQRLHESGMLTEFEGAMQCLTGLQVVLAKPDAPPSHGAPGADIKVGAVLLGRVTVRGHVGERERDAVNTLLCLAAERMAARLLHPMPQGAGVLPHQVHEVTRIIKERFQEPLRLRDLARHLGLSQERLSRLFRASLGVTFSEYLNQVRLDHCKTLLETGNAPIIEVAMESGFQSISQFNRRFRAAEKISPSQYREARQWMETAAETIL